MKRGEIWWATLGEPEGSEPGYRRPTLIVQSNVFNASKINTVIVVTMTSNLSLALAPGNIFLKAKKSGLPKDSVINVSQLLTLDRQFLTAKVKMIDEDFMLKVDLGLKLVLDL